MKRDLTPLSQDDTDCVGPRLYGQDYGVLLLERPVSPGLASPVEHIASGSDLQDIEPETTLRVVGFGRNPAFGAGSGWKNYVEIPVLSPSCADPGAKWRYGCVGGRELVSALGPYNRSPCNGDSGGAAFVLDKALGSGGEPARILVGLVSRGVGYLNDKGEATEPVWPDGPDMLASSSTSDSRTCSGATVFTLVGADVRKLIADAKGR